MCNRIYITLLLALMLVMPFASANLIFKFGDTESGSTIQTVYNQTAVNMSDLWDNLDTPADIEHNDLALKQGGQAGEYYHGTLAESKFWSNHTLTIYTIWNNLWLSTYNATYANYLFGDRNETLDVYNNWNNVWSSTYNETYASQIDTNDSDYIASKEGDWVSTYNSTYEATTLEWDGNKSLVYNHTLDIYTLWGNFFYNFTTEVFYLYNSTWDDVGSSVDTWSTNYTNYYDKSEVDSNLSNYLLLTDQRFNDTQLIESVNSTLTDMIGSTYNETYAGYSYGTSNETIDVFNLYNDTWDNSWVNLFAYNHTADVYNLWGQWFYNMSDGVGEGSSYNITYQDTTNAWNGNASMVYNHTTATYNLYNAIWSSTYNITYDTSYKSWEANFTAYSKFWYNQTSASAGFYNATYASTSADVTANRSKWFMNYTNVALTNQSVGFTKNITAPNLCYSNGTNCQSQSSSSSTANRTVMSFDSDGRFMIRMT